MDIKLNDDQMREVIRAAVLKTLTDDNRETILATAVDFLLREAPTYSGGQKRSPLQEAFNSAISTVAAQMAREELENNVTVKDKLRELLHSAVDQLMENKQQSIKVIADSLQAAMTKRDEY